MLWNAIFSGSETKIIGALIGSFVGLKVAIGGLLLIDNVATKFKAFFKILNDLGITSIGSFVKTFAGISLVITGSVMAVKNFTDMWKNGFDVMKASSVQLGIAIASVGAILLGVSAPIVAVIAGITALTAEIAILTKSFFTN